MKKFKHNLFLKIFINASLCFIGLFLIGLALWTQKFFGIVTLDQVISTIVFSFQGVLASDSVYIERFIEWCITWPAILTCVLVITQFYFARRFAYREEKSKYKAFINSTFKINPYYFFLVLGLILIFHQFSIYDYLKNRYLSKNNVDYFHVNYIDPKQVAFQEANPKSVVIIYVESLESTYSDKKIFGHDLLHSLNSLRKNNMSFSHYKQMPGTGWTIAGIVATQCGIPLRQLTMLNTNKLGENVDKFLPNAKCLSDILAEQGYKNVFMNGSSAKIGGKFKFLNNHHYTEILGKKDWLKQGFKKSDMSNWGLSDHDLLQQAKIKLAKLIKSNQPFNLTILTVDTHGFEGQLSHFCHQQGYHDFEGIVECTGNEVSDFVQYVKKHDWLKKVNIVILGDHLAMKNPVNDKLNTASSRFIFNLFISDQPFYKNTDEIMSFAMFPNILHFIGFNFKTDKLGLGYLTLKKHPNSRPLLYVDNTEKYINYYSKSYAKLWLN